MTLQEMTWIISILTFVGGIATFIFKKIVIEPLQKSINALNDTLKDFQMSTNKQLEIHDKEIELLKISDAEQRQQIKTLFNRIERESV